MSRLSFLSTPPVAAALVHPRSPAPGCRAHVLHDPASGRPCARFAIAAEADVAVAVGRARAAFERAWRTPDKSARIAMLDRLIAAIAARREAFARAISAEMGAPIDFSRDKQVGAALDHLRVIRAVAEVPDDVAPDPAHPEHRIRHEPLGVAALITPWNWPLNQTVLKVGAALVSGCTMILKPSEHATRSALVFAECMAEAGAGDGVFQLVLGDGQTGAALVAHAGVDVISFTGSTRTGAAIAAVAAPQFKRLNLELGGKSANILFADAPLPLAVEQGLAHAFRNTGQSCNAASRMLVERCVYDDVLEQAATLTAGITVDLPSRPGPHLGALVTAAQAERADDLIACALAEGARLVAGGPGRPAHLAETGGFFPRPTVLADVTPRMEIFHEEVFAPVLSITPFESEAEAIGLANDSRYGLAGYVQTADGARADRVARALRVGMVQAQGSSRAPGAPFGGRGASGQGREAGLWGIRAFQDIKSISGIIRLDDTAT